MTRFEVAVFDLPGRPDRHYVNADTAYAAVLSVLNTLGLRYRDTSFSVREVVGPDPLSNVRPLKKGTMK